ncbi:MAG: putative sulfurtransferase [Bacillariaceae sp.]|jgi:predicted sulfurtransferase
MIIVSRYHTKANITHVIIEYPNIILFCQRIKRIEIFFRKIRSRSVIYLYDDEIQARKIKTMATRTCDDDDDNNVNCNVNDNDNADNHDDWRIALYYAYIELTPSEIQSHIDIQKQVCEDLNLKGRIRISKEGVNGVLSGELIILQKYEELISNDIQQILIKSGGSKIRFISSAVNDDDDDNDKDGIDNDNDIDDDMPPTIALDVKYCQLRKELPIQEQLFDRLLIKETKTVISLFDQSFEKKKESKKDRYQRRRERKHEEQMLRMMQNNNNNNNNNDDDDENNSTNLNYQQKKQQQQQCVDRDDDDEIDSNSNNKETKTPIEEENKNSAETLPLLDLQSLHNAVMEESLQPARHLSASEWNKKLDEAGGASSSDSSSALLLDVRNVYEMRVGHFVHPTTPTLLTNTRKYSDLPQLIASNKEIKEREQIFMYCTGGVRCERVSMLVRELYPNKQIYQLRGGIQKYIQTCSDEQQEQQQQEQEDSIDSKAENENNTTTTAAAAVATNSYFAGKNFVSFTTRKDFFKSAKI